MKYFRAPASPFPAWAASAAPRSHPIVNAPEIAILGFSRASLRPVYRDGQFVPRVILPFSLSYDHRANDGAQAARFTSHLRELLGDI